MKIKIESLITLLLIFFISGILLISCSDDNVNDPAGTPPEIPPLSSFQMDFSPFSALSNLSKVSEIDSASRTHWQWAALNGIVWQTLVTAGMSVPVAAFVESFNHDPEQQNDGRWLWRYEFTPFTGIKHTAELYGNVDNNGVTWEMYITKENVFQNFLWYKGDSDIFATGGTWTLYAEPNNPTELLGIEWERNKEDSTGNIKYTNIIPNGAENGGYIFYGTMNDHDYDAFYEINNKGQNNITSIKWNRTTHEGRVKDMNHFGNDQWHCWDSNQNNIDCE